MKLRWTTLATLLALVGCAAPELPPLDAADAPVWNGEPTAEFEAVGALVWNGEAHCTGTLIAPDVILTAAHCLDWWDGATDVSFFTGPGAVGPLQSDDVVIDVAIHPDWNETNADIALAFLGLELDVEPQWVLVDEMIADDWKGRLVTVVGFGISADGEDDSGLKQRTDVRIYAFDEDVFFHYLMGTNACFGDSGGTTLYEIDGRWFDVGVISALFPYVYEDQICVGGGGYEIRTDLYADWIQEYTAINQEPTGDDDTADGDDGDDDDDTGTGCTCDGSGASSWPTAGLVALLALLLLKRAR